MRRMPVIDLQVPVPVMFEHRNGEALNRNR
jgi:hypothetical protein